jgi:hypothetical protein
MKAMMEESNLYEIKLYRDWQTSSDYTDFLSPELCPKLTGVLMFSPCIRIYINR